MAFMQCTAEQAEKFVSFLEASGAWKQSPAGSWEAYRLVKVKPTAVSDFHHSPLAIIVIHKNKKGVHSFDPLHEPAFMNSLVADTAEIARRSLERFVGQPLDGEVKAAVKDTLATALAKTLPGGMEILDTKLQPDGRVDFTLSVPPWLAEKLGISP